MWFNRKKTKLERDFSNFLSAGNAELIFFDYAPKYFGNITLIMKYQGILHEIVTDRGEIYFDNEFVSDSSYLASKETCPERIKKVLSDQLFSNQMFFARINWLVTANGDQQRRIPFNKNRRYGFLRSESLTSHAESMIVNNFLPIDDESTVAVVRVADSSGNVVQLKSGETFVLYQDQKKIADGKVVSRKTSVPHI